MNGLLVNKEESKEKKWVEWIAGRQTYNQQSRN